MTLAPRGSRPHPWKSICSTAGGWRSRSHQAAGEGGPAGHVACRTGSRGLIACTYGMNAFRDLPPAAGGGEEEGAPLLNSQAAANVPVQRRARSPDFAVRPGQGWPSAGTHTEGKGLRCDPDPQSSAGAGQRCQRLPVLPKCTALLCSTWPGLLALQRDAPRYCALKGARRNRKGGRELLRPSTGAVGAMPCRGYPELRGKEPRNSWGRESSYRRDSHPFVMPARDSSR